MNLGIVLTVRDPKEGGGYTITTDIFDKLLSYKIPKNINIHYIIINDHKKYYKKILDKKKKNYSLIFENNYILKVKSFLFCKFSFFLKIYNFLNFNKIENLIKKNKIDIVWPISSELRYPYSRSFFFTVWDLQHKSISQYKEVGSYFIRKYRDVIYKKNLELSKYIICGSRVGINEIIKFYKINRKKIYLNNHPTPEWSFDKKNFKKKKYKKFFIYPANFWSHKNHMNLLKGFNKFLKKNKTKYLLILVGNIVDKKLYNKIINYIFENKISKNVKILGFVSRKKLLFLYDNAIALTYLSVSGPENLPPLEMFARGNQVINSDFKGAREQLSKFPIYVNPNNPIDIANGMSKVLKKKHNSRILKNFARKKNAEKYINKIFEIFQTY
jgi:glycosyltransferase involved in cell wall biosynthesis